jgi:hypothetical protein
MVPRKKTVPEISPSIKELLMLFPERAVRRGTRATQARGKKLKGEKLNTRHRPDRMDSIMSYFLIITGIGLPNSPKNSTNTEQRGGNLDNKKMYGL